MNRRTQNSLLKTLTLCAGLLVGASGCGSGPAPALPTPQPSNEATVVEVIKPADTPTATVVVATHTPVASNTPETQATATQSPMAQPTETPVASTESAPTQPAPATAAPTETTAPQAASRPAAPTNPGSAPDGYKLVFADEFDGPQLDAGKWTTCYHWAQRLNGVLSCATKTELQLFQPDNVTLENGMLRLRLDKPAAKIQAYDREHEYTSGMISSFDKFTFQYGYAEIRARMPKGQGLLSAFWTMPVDKTWPPEIDVIEVLGQDPNTAHLTLHFPKNGEKWKDDKAGEKSKGIDLSADFNTFAVKWEPQQVTWYINGVERYRTDKTSSEPMYLLATLALGGNWAGPPDDKTPFPAYMDIDYIRVYQQ